MSGLLSISRVLNTLRFVHGYYSQGYALSNSIKSIEIDKLAASVEGVIAPNNISAMALVPTLKLRNACVVIPTFASSPARVSTSGNAKYIKKNQETRKVGKQGLNDSWEEEVDTLF